MLNLSGHFTDLVGFPPIGLEWLPYIFSCIFIYFITRFIVEAMIYIFGKFLR